MPSIMRFLGASPACFAAASEVGATLAQHAAAAAAPAAEADSGEPGSDASIDAAGPEAQLEAAIEARNLALLRAGGELEECGRKVYGLREMIEGPMSRDALVAPELRPGRMREAKEALHALLEGHADLTRIETEAFLREVAGLQKRFEPIRSGNTDALQQVVMILRQRLAETRSLLQEDVVRREGEIDAAMAALKRRGGRKAPVLNLQAQLRQIRDLEEGIGLLLGASRPEDPRAFLMEAQKVIKKAEHLALASEAVDASRPGWTRVEAKPAPAATPKAPSKKR